MCIVWEQDRPYVRTYLDGSRARRNGLKFGHIFCVTHLSGSVAAPEAAWVFTVRYCAVKRGGHLKMPAPFYVPISAPSRSHEQHLPGSHPTAATPPGNSWAVRRLGEPVPGAATRPAGAPSAAVLEPGRRPLPPASLPRKEGLPAAAQKKAGRPAGQLAAARRGI